MMPRYAADYRVLLWCFAMPVFAFAGYVSPAWSPYTVVMSAYLALSAGIFAHNHNHCPTFKSRRMNSWFGKYLSLFYGYPTFAWVPTHNLNHHKFVNKAGDATITWRYTNKHHFAIAFAFFFISSYWQSDPINAYIRKAKANNRKLYREIISQYVTWGSFHLAVFALAIALHGWKTGLLVWLCGFGYPAFHALWTIMFFNYVQHVHADPWSKHNHSRNFTGWLLNFTLFNNGLHAAHHEHPGAHWTQLRAYHEEIAAEIDPSLNVNNTAWWLFKVYVLALLLPSCATKQVGRAPWDTGAASLDLEAGDVDAVEAGVTAQMV